MNISESSPAPSNSLDGSLQAALLKLSNAIPRPRYDLLDAKALDSSSIAAVACGDALALRVRGFLSESVCSELLAKAYGQRFSGYGDETIVGVKVTGGLNLWDCGIDIACKHYWQSGLAAQRAVRRHFEPLLSPFDYMHSEIDSAWPAGARIFTVQGLKAHAGMMRLLGPGTDIKPHIDVARDEYPVPETASIDAQLAFNLYLEVGRGGRLSLWRLTPDEDLYKAACYPESPWAVRLDLLPSPDLEIDPQVGDLIAFNACKIHAVSRLDEGRRLAVSCFAAHRGPSEPLELFS